MGTSVITIRITGNHGCQRGIKDGGIVAPVCERGDECAKGCVDALARKAVEMLRASGNVEEATLTHWPSGPQIIVDDLKSGRRGGSF